MANFPTRPDLAIGTHKSLCCGCMYVRERGKIPGLHSNWIWSVRFLAGIDDDDDDDTILSVCERVHVYTYKDTLWGRDLKSSIRTAFKNVLDLSLRLPWLLPSAECSFFLHTNGCYFFAFRATLTLFQMMANMIYGNCTHHFFPFSLSFSVRNLSLLIWMCKGWWRRGQKTTFRVWPTNTPINQYRRKPEQARIDEEICIQSESPNRSIYINI